MRSNNLTCKEFLLSQSEDDEHLNSISKKFDRDFRNFAYRIEMKDNQTVLLDKIIGSSHPNYHGISWVTLLDTHLKRETSLNCISNTKDVVCNTTYYTEGEDYRAKFYQSKDWGVNIINNEEAYITAGNHRSVIAKFLARCNLIPSEIIFPYATYIYCDIEALNKFKSTKKNIENIKILHPHVSYISINAKQIVLTAEDNIETFSIEYFLYMSMDSINTRTHQVFNDMDKLILFMEDTIDKYMPRPFYAKIYNYLKRLMPKQ